MLQITNNLAVALRHLRLRKKSRTLWVDAICINQDDPVERSAEVLEMGSIYRNAQQVVIWLGPASHDSDLALQTLRRVGEAVDYMPEKNTIGGQPGSWLETIQNDDGAIISHADCWFAIKDFLSREWFSRLLYSWKDGSQVHNF